MSDQQARPVEGRRTRRFLKPEMIMAMAAVVMSVCALVVSVVQVRIMREQQKAAVWPYPEIGFSYNEEGLMLSFTNKGIGPALVKTVEITLDGEIKKQWPEVLAAILTEVPNYSYSTIRDRVFPAEKGVRVLLLPSGPDALKVRDALRSGAVRLGFLICYCSVYDDCWELTLERRDPVAECRVDPERQFEQ